jgi:hypothetical protein
MKIIINTTIEELDPNATCTPEQARESLASYCREITDRIHAEYPDAEIEHTEDNTDRPIRVIMDTTTEDDYREWVAAVDRIQEICETVYTVGNFWS